MSQEKRSACWAVIPAAGVGSRMEADLPKQYLEISGKTILEHTLTKFLQHSLIQGIVIAISSEDTYWCQLQIESSKPIIIAPGGSERCHSVFSALQTISTIADQNDWVLVHDAARPCIRTEDIDKLISLASLHPVGGLLAMPVRDTLKRSDSTYTVIETVDRNTLWHALTPQMFRLATLKKALKNAIDNGLIVTDEAQAMELMGMLPALIEGHPDNIKITRPQDMELASYYLERIK